MPSVNVSGTLITEQNSVITINETSTLTFEDGSTGTFDGTINNDGRVELEYFYCDTSSKLNLQ